MQRNRRIPLLAAKGLLIVQAVLPLYAFKLAKPGMYGSWTRGNTLLCALLIAVCALNALLFVRVCTGRRRFLPGFKALEMLVMVLWLLILLAKSGYGWMFVFFLAVYTLPAWIVIDILICAFVAVSIKE